MFQLVLILVALVLSAGCQQKPDVNLTDKDATRRMTDVPKNEPRAQVRIGEGSSEEWGLLPFDILKVYPNQKLTDVAPWHFDGGDWTFFDCKGAPPHPATFTVGVRAKPTEGRPIAW